MQVVWCLVWTWSRFERTISLLLMPCATLLNVLAVAGIFAVHQQSVGPLIRTLRSRTVGGDGILTPTPRNGAVRHGRGQQNPSQKLSRQTLRRPPKRRSDTRRFHCRGVSTNHVPAESKSFLLFQVIKSYSNVLVMQMRCHVGHHFV